MKIHLFHKIGIILCLTVLQLPSATILSGLVYSLWLSTSISHCGAGLPQVREKTFSIEIMKCGHYLLIY